MTKFSTKTWVGTLKVSSPFGAIDSIRTKPHAGVDIITPGACLAPFDGVVTRGLDQGVAPGGYGNHFQIVSHDGRFVFMVGHNNLNSEMGLRSGDRVAAGQKILASYGKPSTGNTSGPHYHEQLTDHGRLVNLLDYLGKTWGEPAEKPPIVAGGWDGVSTLYKGNYADDGLVYTIRVGETIYAAAREKGVTLDQARAWTNALANSKYAAGQLAKSGPGASYWDGSDRYFAGSTFATSNVVAKFAAEDAKVAASKQAAAQQAMNAAAEATDAVEQLDKMPMVDALVEAAVALEVAEAEVERTTTDHAEAIKAAAEQIPVIVTNVGAALSGDETADSTKPLAGLLNEHPRARKRVYYAYAALALLVSMGPDVVVAGILTDSDTPGFVAGVALASSVLLKLGTAFGFVAASNTAKAK